LIMMNLASYRIRQGRKCHPVLRRRPDDDGAGVNDLRPWLF